MSRYPVHKLSKLYFKVSLLFSPASFAGRGGSYKDSLFNYKLNLISRQAFTGLIGISCSMCQMFSLSGVFPSGLEFSQLNEPSLLKIGPLCLCSYCCIAPFPRSFFFFFLNKAIRISENIPDEIPPLPGTVCDLSPISAGHSSLDTTWGRV